MLISIRIPSSMEYQDEEHYIETVENARKDIYESTISRFLRDISTIIYDYSENKKDENVYYDNFDEEKEEHEDIIIPNKLEDEVETQLSDFRKEKTKEELDKEITIIQSRLNRLISDIERFMPKDSQQKMLDEITVTNIENLLLPPFELQHNYYEIYRKLVNSDKLSEKQKEDLEEEYGNVLNGLNMFNAMNDEDDEDGNPPKPEFRSHCTYVNRYEKLSKIHESLLGNP